MDAILFYEGTRKRTIKPSKTALAVCIREEQISKGGLAKPQEGGRERKLRISSSTIGMESARSYTSSYVTSTKLSLTQYQGALAKERSVSDYMAGEQDSKAQENAGESEKNETAANGADNLTNQAEQWQSRFQSSVSRVNVRSSNALLEMRQQCIRYIFELLFGRGKNNPFEEWMEENGYDTASQDNASGSSSWNSQNSTQTGTQGIWNTQNDTQTGSQGIQVRSGVTAAARLKVLNYQQQSWHIETEDTSFSTEGKVRTADGREISFNLEVGMSRQFREYYEENLILGEFMMCDPLVINLEGNAADVSDQTFYFDIDADGETDEISRLGTGSGYLALDKNGDGIINDGSELFGTKSGNGFADLAEYDSDGNGWIDENDAVWNKLQIWCKDENGNDQLYRLADKGVGAICLKNVLTEFDVKNQTTGQTKASVRKTGIFLYENGAAGTIQHLDMTKFNQNA